MNRNLLFLKLLVVLFCPSVRGEGITTNNVILPNPPSWLNERRVERVTSQLQAVLEWDIRRVKVSFISGEKEFENLHHLGPTVEAFFRRSDSNVFLGPKVKDNNFDAIFGHELAHVIIFQKYHDAIPPWLEEGLANFVAKKGKVDYAWLATQTLVPVRSMTHPYGGSVEPRFHYMASTAVVEMIASGCSLSDLLQLSVGKKLETYLGTYCEISDLDAAFRNWIEKKKSVPHPSLAIAPASRDKYNQGRGK